MRRGMIKVQGRTISLGGKQYESKYDRNWADGQWSCKMLYQYVNELLWALKKNTKRKIPWRI